MSVAKTIAHPWLSTSPYAIERDSSLAIRMTVEVQNA